MAWDSGMENEQNVCGVGRAKSQRLKANSCDSFPNPDVLFIVMPEILIKRAQFCLHFSRQPIGEDPGRVLAVNL